MPNLQIKELPHTVDTNPLPLAGLNDHESIVQDKSFSPNLRNVRAERDKITKGPGLTLWAPAPVTAGVPRNLVHAYMQAVTEAFLMLTSATAYVWNGSGWSPTAEVYTGATSARFSVANALDRTVWSQGSDNIRVYDGTTFSQLVNIAARSVFAFNNRIVAINTTEVDGYHPGRARWSANGVITDWSGLSAGFLECVQYSSAPLTGGFVLNNQLILGKKEQLTSLAPTGTATSAFQEVLLVSGVGIVGRHSIAKNDYFAYWWGNDNVYMWDGATERAIGQNDYVTMLSVVDQNSTDKIQGALRNKGSEYWLLMSETAEGGVFIYDTKSDRWYRDHWPNVRSLGVFGVGTTITTNVGASSALIVATLDGVTGRVDDAVANNLGAPIDAYFETADTASREYRGKFPVQSGKANTVWRASSIMAPGQSCEIAVSLDKGQTWLDAQTVTASTDLENLGNVHADFCRSYNQVRVRFRNNSVNAAEWLGSWQLEWNVTGANR